MTEIDDDVIEKASEVYYGSDDGVELYANVSAAEFDILRIARAIQAARNEERERCASVVERLWPEADELIDAIREDK